MKPANHLPGHGPSETANIEPSRERKYFGILTATGFLLCLLYALIHLLWQQNESGPISERPILSVTWLFIGASGIWLCALCFAVRLPDAKWPLVPIIAVFATTFRLILLFTSPILEIDVYRYMWDGMVVNQGISPYRFSPQQVLADNLAPQSPDLEKLVALSSKSEGIHRIVTRVHYAQYTTIYPPVSQAVFALAMYCVPDSASVWYHLLVIKTILVLFDIATIGIVLCMLQLVGMHPGWALAYAWNPLVIKEIANSGHLDSVAVCFTAASIYGLMRWLSATHPPVTLPRYYRCAWIVLSAVTLSFGIGAKLFPIILVPMILFILGKKNLRLATVYALLVGGLTTFLMVPMLRPIYPPGQAGRLGGESQHQSQKNGLSSFLSHWRMNDIAFSFVYENAKPDPTDAQKLGPRPNRPWFVLVPDPVRQNLDQWIRAKGLSRSPPFFVARLVTLSLLAVLYAWILIRLRNGCSLVACPQYAFAILAAFFFLQPTQNPWYWLWAMPFVCFTPNRGWLLVACCLFVYYFRFWCKFSEVGLTFASIHYHGVGCFDFCVVWLEYLPVLGALMVCRKFGRSPLPKSMQTLQ